MNNDRPRCSAHHTNGDGKQCKNAPMAGTTVCRVHGGSAPQVRKKAQERIALAADPAAAKLVSLMSDKKVPYAIQLAAARDLLDRAGITSKQVVGVEIRKYEQLAESGALLIDLPEPEQILDAEVVDTDKSDRDWVERVDGPLPAPSRRQNIRRKGGRQAPR